MLFHPNGVVHHRHQHYDNQDGNDDDADDKEEDGEYGEGDPLIYLPAPSCWFQLDGDDDDKEEIKEEEGDVKEDKEAEFSTDSVSECAVKESLEAFGPFQTAEEERQNNIVYWRHQVTNTWPTAAQELLSASIRRAYHKSRLSYASHGFHKLRHSDLGNTASGSYFRVLQQGGIVDAHTGQMLWRGDHLPKAAHGQLDLPPFSSLPWVDRQLVAEWRTFDHTFASPPISPTSTSTPSHTHEHEHEDDCDFEIARTLAPKPLPPPPWENAPTCFTCQKPFNSTLLRHHCRVCGHSYCHAHSNAAHKLPHFGYDPDVPERVCASCKTILEQYNLNERIAWRMARCRDLLNHQLTPYFETGVDTVEDVAYRLTRAAIRMARSIPLGAQAHVAVETIEVLRKHGLKGVYGLVLRKEFMAAADLLCKVTGINKKAWPLSVHELSAAIFYALAQHRGFRGMKPERENFIHALIEDYPDHDDPILDEEKQQGQHDNKNHSMNETYISSTIVHTHNTLRNDVHQKEEDEEEEVGDEGGDTIVWQQPNAKNQNPILDETDTFDPSTESTVNYGGIDLFQLTNNRDEEQRNNCITDNITIGVNDDYFHNRRHHDTEKDIITTDQENGDQEKNKLHYEINIHNHGKKNENHKPQQTPQQLPPKKLPFKPVCEAVSDSLLSSLIFYAPLALSFIYATSEVDMQLLAAQQGWRLLYAHIQDHIPGSSDDHAGHGHGYSQDIVLDRPASALFVHEDFKIACFAIRGTATINDVVTDIRAMPVPFPEIMEEYNDDDDGLGEEEDNTCMNSNKRNKNTDNVDSNNLYEQEGWTPISQEGKGLALCGMARASTTLFKENIDALTLLAKRGYKIRITGHSLGGGVAALMGALVKKHFEQQAKDRNPGENGNETETVPEKEVSTSGKCDETGKSSDNKVQWRQQNSRNPLERQDLLRVYGYGTPSCVDAKLSDFTQSYVTNVVLHDDVVPRLTPTSIRCLLKHLLYVRETWVKEHLTDDIMAITERAKTAWAPRWRCGFTLLATSSARKLRHYKRKAKYKLGKGVLTRGGRGRSPAPATNGYKHLSDASLKSIESNNANGEGENYADYIHSTKDNRERTKNGFTSISHEHGADDNEDHSGFDDHEDDDPDNQSGMFYDGDNFFEAEETLIESDTESVNSETGSSYLDPAENYDSCDNAKEDEDTDDWVPFDEPPMAKDLPSPKESAQAGTKENSNETSENKLPVMLEEIPLHRMFIPGKIVHVYTHRGGYKAAFVPRAFRELRRVSLAGNMLTDHTSNAYYEGLLEVQSVRNAAEDLPEWTGFDEVTTCSCCASQFTWASTSNSEAQEARDKHNCRSCGSLVCGPCSKNRVPLPTVGITALVRVCDRCYNDRGAILSDGSGRHGLMRSFMESSGEFLETFRSDGSVIESVADDSTEGSAYYHINEDGLVIRTDRPVTNQLKKREYAT